VAGSRETWGKVIDIGRASPPPPSPLPGSPEWNADLIEMAWAYLENETDRLADILGADEVRIHDIANYPVWRSNYYLIVRVDAIMRDHVSGWDGEITTAHEMVILWQSWCYRRQLQPFWRVVSLQPFTRFVDTRELAAHVTEPQRPTQDETFDFRVRYYSYYHENPFAYASYEINAENWVDEIIVLMRQYSDFRIHHMWLDGDKLYVDMKVVERGFIFDGSGAGQHHGSRLISALFGIPDVAEIELLFGGNRRDGWHTWSGQMAYGEVFTANQ